MGAILRNFYVRRLLLLVGIYLAMSVVLSFTSGLLMQARWVLMLAVFIVVIATVTSILRRIFKAIRTGISRVSARLRG